MQSSSVPRRVALLGATLVVCACRTPDEHFADADREVYDIVQARRDELAAGGPFTITPNEDSLRVRLLTGEESLEPLDLFACLDVAAENSREYQTQREALYVAALDLTLERWRFSVQENGTFGAFLARRGADSSGFDADLGLSRLFGTGLSVVGNIGVDLARDISRGDALEAVSNFSLNITQPLLRGFGRDVVMEPLTQAEREVLYEARRYERFRSTFAFDVAGFFFRVLQAEDTLANERQNESNLAVLRERNEAFAEAGLLNEIEVDQARQNELQARNRVIDADSSLSSQLDDFKFFLGLPIDVQLELDPGELLDLSAWKPLFADVDEDSLIAFAVERRLDHLTTLDRVEDAMRKVHVAENALGAGLDLTAGIGGVSQDARGLDFRGLGRSDKGVDWDVRLSLDAPFNRLPERNVYRESWIALEAASRAAVESEDGIRADLRAAKRSLDTARESFDIQTGAVSLAERRVESAQLNLEAGRASTRDVLEAQEDLVDARNSATRALTEFILAGLALYRDAELLSVADGRIDVDTEALLEWMETP